MTLTCPVIAVIITVDICSESYMGSYPRPGLINKDVESGASYGSGC